MKSEKDLVEEIIVELKNILISAQDEENIRYELESYIEDLQSYIFELDTKYDTPGM